MDEVTNALADIACKQDKIAGLIIAYTTHDGEVSTLSVGDKGLELLGLSDMVKQRILDTVYINDWKRRDNGDAE